MGFLKTMDKHYHVPESKPDRAKKQSKSNTAIDIPFDKPTNFKRTKSMTNQKVSRKSEPENQSQISKSDAIDQ